MGVADSKLLEARGSAEALNKIAGDAELVSAICSRGCAQVRAFAYALESKAALAMNVFARKTQLPEDEPPGVDDIAYLSSAVDTAIRVGNEYAPYALSMLLTREWQPLDDTSTLRLLRSALSSPHSHDALGYLSSIAKHMMVYSAGLRLYGSGLYAYANIASDAAYNMGRHDIAMMVLGLRVSTSRHLECGCVYCAASGRATVFSESCPRKYYHRSRDPRRAPAVDLIYADIRAIFARTYTCPELMEKIREAAFRILVAASPDAELHGLDAGDLLSAADVAARLRPCRPSRGPEGGCSVCLETRPLALAVPCGHFSACFRCAARLGDSPCVLCRAPVSSYISTWPVPPPAE